MQPSTNPLPQRRPIDSRRKEARDALLGIQKKTQLTDALNVAIKRQPQSLSPEKHEQAQAALSGKELPHRRPRRGSRGSKKKRNLPRRPLALTAPNPATFEKSASQPIPQAPISPTPQPVTTQQESKVEVKRPVPPVRPEVEVRQPAPPLQKSTWDIPPKPIKKTRLLSRVLTTLVVMILALAGGAGIGALYYYFRTGNVIPLALQDEPATQEQEEQTNTLSAQDIIAYINNVRSSDIPDGETQEIELVSSGKSMDIRDFLQTFTSNTPQELLQSLGNEFVIGVYGGTSRPPFLALEITNFAESYAGMSAWEETLEEDIGDLFTEEEGTEFKSYGIGNVDARILVNDQNTPIITYAFVSRTGLIITTTPETLENIVRSYQKK